MMGYDSADLVDAVTGEASCGHLGNGAAMTLQHQVRAAIAVQRFYRGHLARVQVLEQRVLARQASASKCLTRVRTCVLSCTEAAPVRIKKLIFVRRNFLRQGACSGAIISSVCIDAAKDPRSLGCWIFGSPCWSL
jgi:hypothetical protein